MSPTPEGNRRGVIAMCLAMCVFVANDTLVKLATGEGLHATQIMVMRGLLSSLLLLGVLWYRPVPGWRTLAHPMVLLRALLDAVVAICFMSALPLMPIADLTAIALVSPILITLLSAGLLRETVGWRRWLAVAAGFTGMLLVVRPGGAGFGVAGLLGLASAFGVAARDIITRQLPPGLSSMHVGLTTTFGTLALGLLLTPLWPAWESPTPRALACVGSAAFLLAAGNLLIITAFRDGETSLVSPFRYTNVLWALLSGFLVFGDIPAPIASLGVGFIVASGLYTLHRERVRTVSARSVSFGDG